MFFMNYALKKSKITFKVPVQVLSKGVKIAIIDFRLLFNF